jgi:hypothetical protein
MEDAIQAAQMALTREPGTPTKEAELRGCRAQITARLSLLRSAHCLLEQVEQDIASSKAGVDTAELIAQVTAACQDWPHLIPRLNTLSRRIARAEQKRDRREARIRRSIAAAKRSGEPASIEVAAAAAAAAGLSREAAELTSFGAALASTRKLMKKAVHTKDLDDIERAKAEAAQYECLRRTQHFSDLQSLAAASPGPGQYGKRTSGRYDEPYEVDSPGVSWDTSGVWAWKEIKVRDGKGGVSSQFVRVQCANARSDSQLSQASASVGPGTYGEVSPAVYIAGVKQDHSQVDFSFATETRQAISDRHDLHHGSRPGPGDYVSATHRPAFDENPQRQDSSFSSQSREALQEREARWNAAASPASESYELTASSAFGAVNPVLDEDRAFVEPSSLHVVFKEVVVNGVKGWARVERS